MRIRISEPRLLPHLLESLRRGDCLALPLDDATCEVVHEDAETEREARIELTFFLRAWLGAHPGAQAELLA
jgi:hypothetical protein